LLLARGHLHRDPPHTVIATRHRCRLRVPSIELARKIDSLRWLC